MQQKSFNPDFKGMLHGLRVIDLSRVVAGNMLTLQLADHGADVIKIEPLPAGDPLRAWKENGYSAYWKIYARNKRSLGLNFRAKGASNLLRELAVRADVLVEGFRPGTLEEMGLAPATLHAQNPGLIIVRISGFGQTGPYAPRPGFGTLVEAMSGFSARNGFADREPVLPPSGPRRYDCRPLRGLCNSDCQYGRGSAARHLGRSSICRSWNRSFRFWDRRPRRTRSRERPNSAWGAGRIRPRPAMSIKRVTASGLPSQGRYRQWPNASFGWSGVKT